MKRKFDFERWNNEGFTHFLPNSSMEILHEPEQIMSLIERLNKILLEDADYEYLNKESKQALNSAIAKLSDSLAYFLTNPTYVVKVNE